MGILMITKRGDDAFDILFSYCKFVKANFNIEKNQKKIDRINEQIEDFINRRIVKLFEEEKEDV